MEITIKAEPKEIAALVVAIQERLGGETLDKKVEKSLKRYQEQLSRGLDGILL